MGMNGTIRLLESSYFINNMGNLGDNDETKIFINVLRVFLFHINLDVGMSLYFFFMNYDQ